MRFIVFGIFFGLFGLLQLISHHPTYKVWGSGTDHISHSMTVFLFLEHQFEIYQEPVTNLCPIKDSEKITQFKEKYKIPEKDLRNVCQISPDSRVLFFSWPEVVRSYPPGELLIGIPGAIFYSISDDFDMTAIFLAVIYFLTAAGCALLILYALRDLKTEVGDVTLALICGFFLPMGLDGYYDSVPALFIVLSILYALKENNPVKSFLFFALAGFFHFRYFMYFPMAGWLFYRNRKAMNTPVFWVACYLILFTVFTLWLSIPGIKKIPAQNPFLTNPQAAWYQITFILAAVFSILIITKRYLVASVLFTLIIGIAQSPVAQPWHMMALLPLLLFPTLDKKPKLLSTYVILVVFLLAMDQMLFHSYLAFGSFLPSYLLETINRF